MPERSLTFSVVIPTLGRTERLAVTLSSLAECRPRPAEVIVVDGEGSEATRDVVEAFARASGIEAHHLSAPAGMTRQRNIGLERAVGDISVFVDDDVSFHRSLDAFSILAATFDDATIVGATARIAEDEGRRYGRTSSSTRRVLLGAESDGTFTEYGYRRYPSNPSLETDVEYMFGCFMCARTAPARELRFDEALTGYALCEDEDFSYRLSRQGRIRYLPSIVIEHDRSGGSNAREKNRMLVANRAYLFRKNFAQTPRARAKFAAFIGMLVGHRLLNGEVDGARGLVEGIGDAMRGRIPYRP